MNKATKFTMYLALFIILLFSTGMAMTYVNDYLQQSGFFGDTKTSVGEVWDYWAKQYKSEIKTDGLIDKHFIWGARHYWYHTMCILLFILSVARIVIWINFYWKRKI